jgi:hypothetical protein
MKSMKKILLLSLLMSSLWIYAVEPSTILKHFKVDNISISNFVDLLRDKYKMNVVLRETPEELKEMPLISLDFKNIPLWVPVKYACMQTGLKYQFRDEMLFIGKKIEIEKTYYAGDFKDQYTVLGDSPGTSMYVGRIYYIPIGYYPGRIAISGGTVTYVGPKPIFKEVKTGFMIGDIPETSTRLNRPVRKKSRFKIPYDYPVTKGKLFSLKVSVDFETLPLDKALNNLRDLSIKADPRREGVNFYVIPFKGQKQLIVDMVLNRMPLHRILKYLCQTSRLNFRVAPYVVEIYRPHK